MAITEKRTSAWQRLIGRLRRAIRAFESDRTDTSSTWTFHVRLEPDELDGGWIAECVDLPGCISEGETEAEALANISDAIGEVIAVRMEQQLPDVVRAESDSRSPRDLAVSIAAAC